MEQHLRLLLHYDVAIFREREWVWPEKTTNLAQNGIKKNNLQQNACAILKEIIQQANQIKYRYYLGFFSDKLENHEFELMSVLQCNYLGPIKRRYVLLIFLKCQR